MPRASSSSGSTPGRTSSPTRFDSADEHRPAYGDAPESFLADQAARREPLLGEVGAHVIDVDTITPDEVVTRALGLLG